MIDLDQVLERWNWDRAVSKVLKALCAGHPNPQRIAYRAEIWRYGTEFYLRLEHCLQAGRFRPGPLNAVKILKTDGSVRTLCVPRNRDRIVHAAGHGPLQPVLDELMSESSFGFRPGKGPFRAMRRLRALAREFPFVGQLDIKDAFPSVKIDRLIPILRQHLGKPLCCVVHRLCMAHRRLHGIEPELDAGDGGLPQGTALSPLLCNLYLDKVDRALEVAGIVFVRYVDNFWVFAKSLAEVQKAMGELEMLLRRSDLRPKPASCMTNLTASGFLALGWMITSEECSPSRKAREHYLRMVEQVRPEGPNPKKLKDQIRGWLAYYRCKEVVFD